MTTIRRLHTHGPTALVGGLILVGLLAGAAPAAAGDTRGFLYGRITTESGSTFEGRLRWGSEEAFWGDFFNSVKQQRTMPDEMPPSARKRERIRIFGVTVGLRWRETSTSRAFKARFGDIREIRVGRGERATLVMKSGTEYEIDGGSNDVGGKVQVWDPDLGRVDVEWKKISRIEFRPAPRNLDVADFRLHGTVHTTAGEFRGFIQWDQDECLSSDKLDGETRDAELSLEMGKIRTIERRSRSSSRVTLRDGRQFELRGSNDVDSDNRGIFVDDERYGRVLIPWDAFERVEFREPRDSGPAYDEFKTGGPLRGSVTDVDGAVYRGRIVYDLDESEGWELFDGNDRDIEYSIPFAMIASITPAARGSVRVALRRGETLELADTADAGDGNDGVLILEDERRKVYVPWDEVRRVEFER